MSKKIETILAQLGNRSEERTGAVSAPIYLSTAFRHEGLGKSTGFDYTRTSNPTRQILEDGIAQLEDGDQGFACSSGMAAIQTVFSLFKKGDHILVSRDLYGGTFRLFEQGWKKWGLDFDYVHGGDEQFAKKIQSNTVAIFIETPTNPLMFECNISEIAKLAKEKGLLLIVDNTFYTPVIQQPIREGADIVVHSATKYLGGHNDVLAGLIVTKGKSLSDDIAKYHNAIGATLGAFDSWLLLRGMKTLALRMQKHEQNAKAIAEFLQNREGITDVFYPGKGGMLSFRVKDASWVDPFLRKLEIITFAESLGGVESFITYPTTQTHSEVPAEIRNEIGVCNRLLRFSVGIEDVEDLIRDLNQALDFTALEN
ncbi:methionine biosynthesis PLP-dependent protein [Pueribacillus theae]|uniref:Methionine biosynthesis PLP-dependent protein n=1 Tax=Pueribacillus theae TaxID=2171751 RepID=A0A2U1K4E0_9BACI|nr:methionine biosynthesis PLP-dependent protein [Pueribacillus theae]PWA12397.1 methionine biosynthesis PLP-dependent protein [Pueribacillus theae]